MAAPAAAGADADGSDSSVDEPIVTAGIDTSTLAFSDDDDDDDDAVVFEAPPPPIDSDDDDSVDLTFVPSVDPSLLGDMDDDDDDD